MGGQLSSGNRERLDRSLRQLHTLRTEQNHGNPVEVYANLILEDPIVYPAIVPSDTTSNQTNYKNS